MLLLICRMDMNCLVLLYFLREGRRHMMTLRHMLHWSRLHVRLRIMRRRCCWCMILMNRNVDRLRLLMLMLPVRSVTTTIRIAGWGCETCRSRIHSHRLRGRFWGRRRCPVWPPCWGSLRLALAHHTRELPPV